MQFKKQFLLLPILAVITGTIFFTAAAQPDADESCSLDITTVMNEVNDICTGIGENQVCYGKEQVNALAREEADTLEFEKPGDNTDLSDIQSLFLSKLDPVDNSWGIAQMRLLVTTSQQPADVTLLLFGNVSIENANEPRLPLEVMVKGPAAANIRAAPSLDAFVAGTAAPGGTLQAIGRLPDNSWLRVEDELGLVGWITTEQLSLTDADSSLEDLTVEESRSPYYGAMQAFYFESESSNSCGNVVSDGLLIQTPDGIARVTLLINEVTVELLGADQGEGATALVQSNEETGLTLDMLSGSGSVTVEETTVEIASNMSVNVPMDENNTAAGVPSEPEEISQETRGEIVLLPLVEEIELEISTTNNFKRTSTAAFTVTVSATHTSTRTATQTPTASPTASASPTLTETFTLIPPTDTNVPPANTEIPPTDTNVPPTSTHVPPTNTEIPPTNVPPTDVLPTDEPVTDVPPTNTEPPPTDVPPTEVPPTDEPATDVLPTESPSAEGVPTDLLSTSIPLIPTDILDTVIAPIEPILTEVATVETPTPETEAGG